MVVMPVTMAVAMTVILRLGRLFDDRGLGRGACKPLMTRRGYKAEDGGRS